MRSYLLRGLFVIFTVLVLVQQLILGEPIDFSKYHKFSVIERFLLHLAISYNRVRLSVIGHSWQGKPIYALLIGDIEKKPIVLIVGLYHGRELISAQFPLYFTWLLLTNDSYGHLLDFYSFVIVPILNPDGYEEAFRNPWQRKNCRPIDDDNDGLIDEDPPEDLDRDGRIARYYNTSSFWYEGIDNDGDGRVNEDWIGGVDLNRNYPFMWRKGSRVKSSLIYRGPRPLSEPETKALDLLVRHYAKRIVIALSYHSGASLVLYPWSYTREAPPHERLFKEIGLVYANTSHCKLKQSSHLYLSFGEFMDYLYHDFNIITLTIEIYGWATNSTWFRSHIIRKNKTRVFRDIFEAFNPVPCEELLRVLRLHAIALNNTLTYYEKYALIMYRDRIKGLKPNPIVIMSAITVAVFLSILTGYKGVSKTKKKVGINKRTPRHSSP